MTTKAMELCDIFYTQDMISERFDDGTLVDYKNILQHEDKAGGCCQEMMRVTQARNGRWYTLNNRTLFALRMANLWTDEQGAHYVLNTTIKVQEVDFWMVQEEFQEKFTSRDNGNTCIMKEMGFRDWVATPHVNVNDYKLKVAPWIAVPSSSSTSYHEITYEEWVLDVMFRRILLLLAAVALIWLGLSFEL